MPIGNNFLLLLFSVHVFFSFSVLKDPGGLTDYIDAEYIPDFLGGPYGVRSLVIKKSAKN